MKAWLLERLACPWCAKQFEVDSFDRPAQRDEVTDGILRSPCGRTYPIVDTIPRILDDAFVVFAKFSRRYADRLPPALPLTTTVDPNADALRQIRDRFGYQWTLFSEMVVDFRESFLHYIHPLDESFFPGKIGLDVGCGFGRHIYNAAKFGAEMVGVDMSAGIDAARRNTQHLANVHLVQADLYHLPFRKGSFDFAYSIGVLHHLPDPEAGFRCLIPMVKPGGAVFIWVYSKSRRVVNFLLESARFLTTRLPRTALKLISFSAAAVDWVGFIVPYRMLSSRSFVGPFIRKVAFPRLQVYSAYPFQVVWADWFDRLAAPIRFYYDWSDVNGWLTLAKLDRTMVSPTGLFGWRAYGERPR